ncbi:putative fibrinogen-like protein A-like [Apostichopus japonicus]|uniref:Putative fibrinogen-like protein A-like n=1 Tax=Stichopus japonicus TaxID=307972 RepID=A0A2G8JT31_STIJA|nr:putative fibrinogen-like protein A-like [Apostichopus japonicus]
MIKPDGYLEPFEVYCDSTDISGGWTVIQRRIDGSIDFGRDWDSYKTGFGFLSREFWLCNEKLSFLTNQKKYQLVFDMTTSNGSLIRVSYEHFRISDAFSYFKLVNLGQYSGETVPLVNELVKLQGYVRMTSVRKLKPVFVAMDTFCWDQTVYLVNNVDVTNQKGKQLYQ